MLEKSIDISNDQIILSTAQFYVKFMREKWQTPIDYDEAKVLASSYTNLPLKELNLLVIRSGSPVAIFVLALRDVRGEDE